MADYDGNNYEDACFECQVDEYRGVHPCATHRGCTPEERAVIQVVNRFYETPELSKPRFISHYCDTGHCTDRERDLLDALLAARAGKETSGSET